MKWPKTVLIYTDGACRGNPGPCSLGLQVLSVNKELVYQEGSFLESHNTNNYAEYKALIRALELCVKHQVKELFLFSDSLLIIQQLSKKYKVKSANLKPLFNTCEQLLKKIPQYKLSHIPRDKNKSADALANQALNQVL